MKSTREKILRTLLAYPGSTINTLAEAVGINGISIRHHLTALEAEDLVVSAEERHGVGRPRLIYSLSEKGIETFPTSYLRLTHHILDVLTHKLPPAELHELFEDIGMEMAEPYEFGIDGKPLDERIELLKTAMTKEGFIIEIQKNADEYILTSLSCPYFKVGKDHPIVCTLDHTLISRLLGTPFEVVACICQGADRCIYKIPAQSEG
jgi:DeoR family transcriptional regulator, suf operon transcriptional repressor